MLVNLKVKLKRHNSAMTTEIQPDPTAFQKRAYIIQDAVLFDVCDIVLLHPILKPLLNKRNGVIEYSRHDAENDNTEHHHECVQ